MKREILIVAGVSAALAIAAFVRPPRATPAFSAVATPGVIVSGAPRPDVMVSPSTPLAHGSLRSGQASSNHRRRRQHRRASRTHGNRKPRRHIELVDVNHADATMLSRVPGITPDLARRIVAYRALVGPFATLDDLSDLDGLSEGRLISLGRYLVAR